MIKLINGDCLEAMKDIESGSIDMILTDPPYGTVKELNYGSWKNSDKAWDTVIEQGAMLRECNRVLRTNGALLLFCQEPYTSKLITEARGNLPFSYRLTWLKDHFANALGAKKAPVNYIEDICVFFKKHTKHDFKGLHPLRQYAELVYNYICVGLKQINTKLGHRRAEHFFYINSTQFKLCTEAVYNELVDTYGIDNMQGFRSYKDIKLDDEAYRTDLIKRMIHATPKIFNLLGGAKYKSNVLSYKKDYTGHHPTQKPVLLLEDLIKTYTNESDTVLDFTMGSGSTGVACVNTNREFIGIELDKGYFNIAKERIHKGE